MPSVPPFQYKFNLIHGVRDQHYIRRDPFTLFPSVCSEGSYSIYNIAEFNSPKCNSPDVMLNDLYEEPGTSNKALILLEKLKTLVSEVVGIGQLTSDRRVRTWNIALKGWKNDYFSQTNLRGFLNERFMIEIFFRTNYFPLFLPIQLEGGLGTISRSADNHKFSSKLRIVRW